jgi:hypothetical protein
LQAKLGSAMTRDLVERSGRSGSPAHQTAVAQATESRMCGGVAVSFRSRSHAPQRQCHLVGVPRLDGDQPEHERAERASDPARSESVDIGRLLKIVPASNHQRAPSRARSRVRSLGE